MAGNHLDFDRYVPFALIATANALSTGASRAYLSAFGVGVSEWRILANLKAQPGITANAICASSRLDKAGVSRAVAALTARGYIAAGADAEDRRRRGLYLTDAGVALHDRMIDVALERERRLLNGFSDDEAQTLRTMLARMRANAEVLDNG